MTKKRVSVKKDDVLNFSAKTANQKSYVRSIIDNTVTFCTGCAGTGKSYLALGIAAQKLMSGEFDKIVIVRPAIEASERGIGFLKGSYADKVEPYCMPAIEHLKKFLGVERFAKEYGCGNISFEVLEYLRGRTFDYTMMIGEEFQNCTTEQLIMFISRIGSSSKIVINGDSNQSDMIHKNGDFKTDLDYVIHKINKANLENFNHVEMTDEDIIRNPIIGPFLKVFK